MSNLLLAVDPGIRGCGAAAFSDGVLVEAAYLVSPCKKANQASAADAMAKVVSEWCALRRPSDEIALEWPRIYASRIRAGASPGDPNDLLALSAVDAAIVAYLAVRSTCYYPSDWKGQLPKAACLMRITSRLSEAETAVTVAAALKAKSKAHNMFDAVGIGLHHLGRLGIRRAA